MVLPLMTPQWISKLSEIVCADIARLFNKFEIKYREGQTRIYGRCPVHDSDNHNSLTIYLDGHTLPFVWKCWTNHCEETYKKTVIGFTRGILSRENGSIVSFGDTVKFLLDLYKIDPNSIQVNPADIDKKNFIAQTNLKYIRAPQASVSREKVRARLQIPAEYYIKRGYSPEVLDKYDVGLCNDSKKDMYGRVVAPIYEDTAKFMVGCIGRSTGLLCGKCGRFHLSDSCPPPSRLNQFSKWKVSGLQTGDHLYNYWFAHKFIKKSSTAILVESPGNVWRLEEAGFHNSVALFGTQLSDSHQFLLEKLGVMNLVVIMDNDPAGRQANENIRRKCEKYYNLKFLYPPPGGDVGEMQIKDIQNLLKGTKYA